MAAGDQPAGSSTGRRDSSASNDSAVADVSEALKAKCTHHAPRKRLFTKLQALVTSPKRAYEHAERDGLGGIAGALTGRRKRDSISKEDSQTRYRERLASDASLSSPASGPRSTASPVSSHVNAFNYSSTNPTSPETPFSARSSEAPYLTSSPVKREDKLYSPSGTGISQSQTQAINAGFRGESAEPDDKQGAGENKTRPQEYNDKEPKVLLRPHLKLRVVTWNMHDSLPTGDLTELLGAPSSTCDPAAADKARFMPYEPDHAVQPLSSGLDPGAPYHLVVVGGQEVPVGYGGWSGPNWTETIHRWLSGSAEETSRLNGGTQPSTDEEPSLLGNKDRKEREIASPTTPNTAHRAYLAAQSSETLVLPEDAIVPRNDEPSSAVQAEQRGKVDVHYGKYNREETQPSSQLQTPEYSQYLRSPAALASMKMGRSGSSSTTDTDRSVRTDAKSAVSTEDVTDGARDVYPDPASAPADRATVPYILVTKERLMGIYCSLWVHRSCAHLIQGSSTGTVTAGLLAGKLGNKGAACISLKISDVRFLFVCAHLAAHSEKSALRQANVKKIKEELVIDTFLEDLDGKEKPRLRRGLSLSRPLLEREKTAKGSTSTSTPDTPDQVRSDRAGQDITDLFDHTFWFGDLNFRLDISRLHADFLIKEKKFDTALTFDQLQPILNDPKGCFGGFSEAPIKFAPSYKYDVLKLKRSRTVQRTSDAAAGIGLNMSERRTQTTDFTSPTAPTSVNASRTNLTVDVVNEEDEEDNHSAPDRATLGSSRASISSAFSGVEQSSTNYDETPDHETLANTHYNNRSSAGLFGSSIPSTPTTDKVIEKAKGFFHLMRARSPTHSAHTDPESRPALHLDTNNQHRDEGTDAPVTSPLISTQNTNRGPDTNDTETRMHTPIPQAPGGGISSNLTASLEQNVGTKESGKQSLEIPEGQRLPLIHPIRSSASVSSARPRLKSMRSTNTVLSVSSFGLGKSVSSYGQENLVQDAIQDATYDTSSKKRVQSWTDRILFKSTTVVLEDKAESSAAHRSLLGGHLLPSLRNVARSVRDHGDQLYRPTSRTIPIVHDSKDLAASAPIPEAATDDEHVLKYGSQHSPTASLLDSQQRLNSRIAGLFRHLSGGKREGSPDAYTGEQESRSADRSDIQPSIAQPSTPAFGIQRLTRSRSAHSSSSRYIAAAPVAKHTEQDSGVMPEAGPSGTASIVKHKPHRAYTSPLPSVRVGQSFDPAGTGELGAKPLYLSQGDHGKDPMTTETFEAPDGAHPVHLPHSTEMLRHGSEPMPKSIPPESHLALLAASNSNTSPDACLVSGQPRRVFSIGNPFSRAAPKDGVSMASTSRNLPDECKHPKTGKTGIKLLPSKTTPVTSDVRQADERPHLGLRHWWNARMLPHLFSFNSDSHATPSSQQQPEQAASETVSEAPPEPEVTGPRRGEVQCLYYNSISDLRRMEACSDHRPVVAVFAIGV